MEAESLVLDNNQSRGAGDIDPLHLPKDTQFPPNLKTPLLKQTGLVGGEMLRVGRIGCYLSSAD